MSRFVTRALRTVRPRPTRRVRLTVRDLEERTTPAVFTVTNAADAGAGSLRQAITDAVAVNSADSIVFDTTGVFATAQTISLQTALPLITAAGGALTITGTGAASLTVRRDPGAATNFRIFDSLTASLTIAGMTLSGGNGTTGGAVQFSATGGALNLSGVTLTGNTGSDGGALFVTGTNAVATLTSTILTANTSSGEGGAVFMDSNTLLSLQNSAVTGNTATSDGGGLYFFSSGSLRMENSTLSGNSAGGTVGGGGMYFFATPTAAPPAPFTANTVVIRNSTISNNSATAAAGGGIVWASGATNGTLLVQNSTISGNTAASSGGGIGMTSSAPGALRIENSTIAGNTANATAAGTGGGGLARLSGTANTVTVVNSVVSGNTNGNGPDILASAATTTNVNFSAVGSATGFTPSGTSGNNLAFGTDPQLGALASNGGPTQTVLPAAGSPLIGAGSGGLIPAGVTNDQRGFGYARNYGGAPDIGAVEVQPPGLPVALATAATVTAGGAASYTFTVLYADPTGTNNGINTGTVTGNNAAVRVTGPGGFDVPAAFVSLDVGSSGTPRTATYAITPPGGAWDVFDNGSYTVSVQANQVADLDGNFVPAGQVGTFIASMPNFTVFNANDAGFGSLRQVIGDANADPGANTITFDPAFFNTRRTISLQTALPQVTAAGGALTVTGPGAGLATVRRDPGAAATFRVFDSLAPDLTMTGLTVSSGFVAGDGAGLQAGGAVTLDGMAFTGNQATGANDGGAIRVNAGGFLALRNSVITGNSAGRSGGGIYFASGGSLLVENSTITGNSAASATANQGGGALYFSGMASSTPPPGFTADTLVVRNSTIEGNTATHSGGGIQLNTFAGILLVQNSTLSGNTAGTSGGAVGQATGTGSVQVENSTIAGNTAGGTAAGVGGGGVARLSTTTGSVTVVNSVVSGNANANGPDILTGATGSTVDVNFSAVGSATGFSPSGTSGNNLAFGTDPLLGPAANYGGRTRARAPLPGSPLIGAGSNALIPAGVTTDQRGGAFVRNFGGVVDIGAVESQPPFLPIATATAPAVSTFGATAYQFTVTYADPTGTNNGINTAGIIGNNAAVRVAGPGGFDVPAAFVSLDVGSSGTPRTATYAITPPGGAWDGADNGPYVVSVQANQVADLDGNFLAADAVGVFAVSSPFVVTTDADTGAGSLRDALSRANASPAADAIQFSPAFFNTPRTISLQTALPQITAAGGALTVTGPGAGLATVRRDPGAAAAFRVFDSLAPALTMTGFTVSGGNVAGDGAGLQASGIVTLDGMAFTGNQATGANDGGAIRVNSGGFLALRNSTLSGNSAGVNGGAIYFFTGGSLLMENSTITGNTANGTAADKGGGGIYFFGTANATPPAGFTASSLVVRNSTIANNTSASSGGGIVLNLFTGTLLVQDSTITGNTANNTTAGQGGGGIARVNQASATAGVITVVNSVVAGNTNTNGPDVLSANTVNVNFSAVGSDTGYTPSGTSGNNVAAGTDLKLGALGDNGGATLTLAPLVGSPLINAGSSADVPAGLTTDQRGTGFDRISGAAVDIGAFEVQPPRVTVNQAAGQPDPTSTPSAAFAVRFSALVTGFTAAGISLAGSTAAGILVADVTGSGASYTVTVTGMTGLGSVVASVLPGAAADAFGAGNVASTSTDNAVTFDPQAPTVAINRAAGQADPTNAGPIAFTVTFSEPVTGFTETDLSLAGSTAGGTLVAAVSGSGADYTVTLTGMTGVGDVVASVLAGGVLDFAGNSNSASTSTDNVVRFDQVAPTVTIDQAAGQPDPGSASIRFAVVFDEPVTGFTGADVDLAASTTGGPLVANVSGSGSTYTVTVTGMAGPGVVVARIPAAAATDLAGNPGAASSSTDNTVTFDPVAPAVTINQAAGQGDPGGPGPVVFDVEFSEPVTGFTGADVSFAGSTLGGSLAAAVAGSGTTYTVTVSGMVGHGTLVASVPAGGATDPAGNPNEASTSVDNTVSFVDTPGQLEFAPAVFAASETGGSVVVSVTRTGGAGGPVSVDYGTGGGTATVGDDYLIAGGTLNWANGEAGIKTFTITLRDDALVEGAETIGLTLSNPAGGAALGTQSAAEVQLADFEEGLLAFASTEFLVDEEAGTAKVLVTRTGGTDGPVSVRIDTADGLARAGLDYTTATKTLEWKAGEGGTQEFFVPILSDAARPVNEGRETIVLNLSAATGGAIAGPAGTLAIRPSDPREAGTFLDDDRDIVTVKLTGGGKLGFYLTDPDGDSRGPLELIEVSETNPLKSVLSVTAKKGPLPADGKIALGAVTGTGLKSIVATKSDLYGAGIILTGPLGSVSVRDVLNGADIIAGPGAPTQKTRITAGVIDGVVGAETNIQLGTSLAALTATRIGVGSITAPSIGTVTIKGNTKALIAGSLASDIDVSGAGVLAGRPALTTLSAAGPILGAEIDVKGRIGTLRAGGFTGGSLTAASIGTMVVKGNLTTDVTVTGVGVAVGKPALTTLTVTGVVSGTDISVKGNVSAVTAGSFRDSRLYVNYDPITSTFGPAAAVNSFKVTGATDGFQDADVFAPTLKTVSLKSVDTTNGRPFGFTADVAIGSLKVLTGSLFKYNPAGPAIQEEDQFEVKIIV